MNSDVRKILFFIIFMFIFIMMKSEVSPVMMQKIVNGSMDFSIRSGIETVPVSLDGTWEFYWNRFLSPVDIRSGNVRPDTYIEVPGTWKDYVQNGYDDPNTGFCTYRAVIKVPAYLKNSLAISVSDIASSYRLYVNGKLIGCLGFPGTDKNSTLSALGSNVYSIDMPDDVLDIIIHVSNFSLKKGGIWKSIKIGKTDVMMKKEIMMFSFDFFIFGILMALGLYHFSVFYFRRREYSSLYFALFCTLISIRSCLVNARAVFLFFSPEYWGIFSRVEVMTFYFAIPVFGLMIYHLYGKYLDFRVILGIIVMSCVFSLSAIALPLYYVSVTKIAFRIFAMISVSYYIFVIIRAVSASESTAKTFLLSIIILAAAMITDILNVTFLMNMIQVSPIGTVVVMLMQAMVISRKYLDSYRQVETLTEDLYMTSESYSRFVPHSILQMINRADIRHVELGDYSEMEMTVMFVDIRRFTSLSEEMSPEETFKFLNSYLSRMGPIIRKHGGIIDKYIGDGIMSLFSHNTSSAVDAAIEIRKTLVEYNDQRVKYGYAPLDIGIGVHTGTIIVGTIGENERMDGTVISDSVNMASRLENLTKIGAPIIISNITLFELEHSHEYNFRFLGQVFVKGKMKHISVYEIFDFENPDQIELKNRMKMDFEFGILCLYRKDFDEAEKIFKKICKNNPFDKPSRFFLERSKKKMPIPFQFSESMLLQEED